jgi:hypothetical protein
LPMMRANIWPRSPGAALTWLPPWLRRKPCEILVDTQWTDRGGGRKNVKKLLDKLTQMSEGSQGRVREAAMTPVWDIGASLCGHADVRGRDFLIVSLYTHSLYIQTMQN